MRHMFRIFYKLHSVQRRVLPERNELCGVSSQLQVVYGFRMHHL